MGELFYIEQHSIPLISAITLFITIFALLFEKRRRLSKKVREYILEKTDKHQHSPKHINGNLFYVPDRVIYYELKEMSQSFKEGSMEKNISTQLLKEMDFYFPFAKFRKPKK